MTYVDSVLASPYAWILAVAVMLALVLRNIFLLLLHRNAPQRTRDRRLTLLFVFAAVALALSTTTLIVHTHGALISSEALVFLGIATGLLTPAVVFLRAVGIPLLFLLSACGVFAIYLAEPWQPVVKRAELGEVTVLSASGGAMSLELETPNDARARDWDGDRPGARAGEPIIRLPGEELGVTVEIVKYHPYWFLLGRELAARAVTLTGYRDGPLEDVALPDPCADELCRFVHRRMAAIPGIEVERVSSVPVAVEPLSSFTAVVEASGTVVLRKD
ncbi:MAG: hypothetical protein GVY23_00075 [Spirochaetes bacterium]|jgi:hypothetical protein|nr:hypothetical protein [Spirochaetota bacterium]